MVKHINYCMVYKNIFKFLKFKNTIYKIKKNYIYIINMEMVTITYIGEQMIYVLSSGLLSAAVSDTSNMVLNMFKNSIEYPQLTKTLEQTDIYAKLSVIQKLLDKLIVSYLLNLFRSFFLKSILEIFSQILTLKKYSHEKVLIMRM